MAPLVRRAPILVLAFVGLRTLDASAQSLRLGADAVAQTNAPSPAGLLVLQGEDRRRTWLSVEGLVWTGARPDGAGTSPGEHGRNVDGDILSLSGRLRAPRGLGDLRGGRFVLSTGAIRPIHMDGLAALARAPSGTSVEVFGGTPVAARLRDRSYDWLVGGRVAQSVSTRGVLGLSYLGRRSRGDIADEEIGADLAMVPVRWIDLAARSAYDLSSPGVADAHASVAARRASLRVEAFASHRSPGRLLPATSLFSVLGDLPSRTAGATVRWDAAPRLDLLASAAGQTVGGDPGGNAWLRATLRLDDGGEGRLGVEARRQDVSSARWTGLRLIGAHPLGRGLRVSSELELVLPDAPRGRGAVWPWGLLALGWRSGTGWEAAGAVEAASTPERRAEVNALARLSRTLELP